MNLDPNVYSGRPADCSNRLPKEIACYDLLERLEIPFRRVDHDAADTIADCEAVDALLGAEICKNLFLCNRQQTEFYLLLLQGSKVFKTKDLSQQLGVSRLSFGSAEKMQELLDLTPGSVTVLGLMNDPEQRVKLLIDKPLLSEPMFGCHPCINTSSLLFSTDDLLTKLLPGLGRTYTIVDLPVQSD